MITFNDFKESRKVNKEARKVYVNRIRDSANKLLGTYVKSLHLPKEFWTDAKGGKHPYVYIQDIQPRNGDGIDCKPTDITVDTIKGAEIILFTLTDDDPSNPQYERLNISVGLVDDDVEIIVSAEHEERFHPVDSDAKYSEICEFIKGCILKSIKDKCFGRPQPKESVNIWD